MFLIWISDKSIVMSLKSEFGSGGWGSDSDGTECNVTVKDEERYGGWCGGSDEMTSDKVESAEEVARGLCNVKIGMMAEKLRRNRERLCRKYRVSKSVEEVAVIVKEQNAELLEREKKKVFAEMEVKEVKEWDAEVVIDFEQRRMALMQRKDLEKYGVDGWGRKRSLWSVTGEDKEYQQCREWMAENYGIVNVAWDEDYGCVSVEQKAGLEKWRSLKEELEKKKEWEVKTIERVMKSEKEKEKGEKGGKGGGKSADFGTKMLEAVGLVFLGGGKFKRKEKKVEKENEVEWMESESGESGGWKLGDGEWSSNSGEYGVEEAERRWKKQEKKVMDLLAADKK